MYGVAVAGEEPSWAKPFRQRLRLALIEEDITLADLRRRVGWTSQRMSNYMNGLRKPGVKELLALSQAAPALNFYDLLAVVAEVSLNDVPDAFFDMVEDQLTPEEFARLGQVLNIRYPAVADEGPPDLRLAADTGNPPDEPGEIVNRPSPDPEPEGP